MSNIYSLVQYTTYGEHAHVGHNVPLTVTFQDGIVMTQKTQIIHIELLVLQRNTKECFVNPKEILGIITENTYE